MEPPQSIEVERMLVNPHDLDDFRPAGGALSGKQGLIHEREPIIQLRITIGCSAVDGRTCRSYSDGHVQMLPMPLATSESPPTVNMATKIFRR